MKIIAQPAIITPAIIVLALLADALCHAAMHVAAVLHGPEQVVQLSPHYTQP